jgi:hypothetical protein
MFNLYNIKQITSNKKLRLGSQKKAAIFSFSKPNLMFGYDRKPQRH